MGEGNLNVLAVAGSLRTGSYNRALLQAALELAPAEWSVSGSDLGDLPMFNADLEQGGDPDPVRDWKRAVHAADLVLIATPEYNQAVPPLVKNAVDWASRPPKPHAWDGRPVAIMGASPGRLGTVGAQRVLRESLAALNAYVMPQPRMLVAGAGGLFEDGRLVDAGTRDRLASFLEAAGRWASRLRP